jgi:hypothetical protein
LRCLVRRHRRADAVAARRCGRAQLEAAAGQRLDEEDDALRGGRAAMLLDGLHVELVAACADDRRIPLHR